MKNKLKLIILVILVVLVVPVVFVKAESFPAFPMSFYGTAKLNGNNLPVGTKIQVYAGSMLKGEVTIRENGIYGYDNPTKIKLVVSEYTLGSLIFKYLPSGLSQAREGDSQIIYSNGFISGTAIEKNLNFTRENIPLTPGSSEAIISSADTATSTIVIPSTVTAPKIDLSALANLNEATISGAIEIQSATSIGDVSVNISSGTTFSASSAWTGLINAPIVKTNSSVTVVPESGKTANVSAVIEVGFDDVKLILNKAARILIAGQAGKYVGYSRGGAFTQITNNCSADTQIAGDALASGGDCKIDIGSDLVIWTKHFTSFVSYTQTTISAPAPSSGGGGGGGGGGSITVALPTSYSIKINNNATSTDSRNVKLTLAATNATMMVVSNDSAFTGTSFEAYSTAKDWVLSVGAGQKIVYVRFRSSSGGTVDASASINLTASILVPLAPSAPVSDTSQGQVLGVQRFAEGALIRAIGDIDIYIVKYIGSKQFKRLILSPSVFNSYQHLKWDDVLDVQKSEIDAYTTSELVRAVNDTKVYKLYPAGDTGERRWVKTAEGFNRMGFDWDAIYEINTVDRNSYITGVVIE